MSDEDNKPTRTRKPLGLKTAAGGGEVKQTFYIPTQASVPVLPAMANPVSTLLPDVAPASSEQAALD